MAAGARAASALTASALCDVDARAGAGAPRL